VFDRDVLRLPGSPPCYEVLQRTNTDEVENHDGGYHQQT
jgi:hypothetical protein